jgi:hypothetical protein
MATKPVNGVSGLSRFREEWDTQKPRDGHVFENAKSEQGHINVEGSARCLSSAIFTPAAPEFWNAVEPGIRPLVTFLIEKLNCITYSSCEGHPPSDDYPMRGRHVGILPRNQEDLTRLMTVLGAAAEAACTSADRDVVDLKIHEDLITSEGPDVHCVDVLFVAGTLDFPTYAAKAASVQAAFLERLAASLTPSAASPASGTGRPRP